MSRALVEDMVVNKRCEKEIVADDPNQIAGYAIALHLVSKIARNKLNEIFKEEALGNFENSPFVPGLAINSAMFTALTGEIILKAWLARENGKYPPEHDLVLLAGKLSSDVWRLFPEQEQGKMMRAFEMHRRDFVDWRYLFEKQEKSNQNSALDERMVWAVGRLIEEYKRQYMVLPSPRQ